MASDKLPNYQPGQVSLNHELQSVQVFQASSDLELHVSGKWCKHSHFCIASLPCALFEPGPGFPDYSHHAHANSLPYSFLKWPTVFLWEDTLAQLLWYFALKSTKQAMWILILPCSVCASKDSFSVIVLVPSYALRAYWGTCNTHLASYVKSTVL